MKRGDLVVVSPFPPYNKPRPALIIQAALQSVSETVTVALITSDLLWSPSIRVLVQPSDVNGLRKPSQVMVDLIVTVPVSKMGRFVGALEPETMQRVNSALRAYLGL